MAGKGAAWVLLAAVLAAGSLARAEGGSRSDLAIRIGNESNRPDGLAGPLTCGVLGSYTFESRLVVDAAYVRLHEPHTPALRSVTDEARATVTLPERPVLGQPLVLAGTAWRNRMIDMYTNLGGLEVTRPDLGPVSLVVGGYAGDASREDVHGGFVGARLALSGESGPVTWELGHLQGRIGSPGAGSGAYRKSSAEAGARLFGVRRLSVEGTLAVEDRHFTFGPGRPASAPADALIVVVGLEGHVEPGSPGEAGDRP